MRRARGCSIKTDWMRRASNFNISHSSDLESTLSIVRLYPCLKWTLSSEVSSTGGSCVVRPIKLRISFRILGSSAFKFGATSKLGTKRQWLTWANVDSSEWKGTYLPLEVWLKFFLSQMSQTYFLGFLSIPKHKNWGTITGTFFSSWLEPWIRSMNRCK